MQMTHLPISVSFAQRRAHACGLALGLGLLLPLQQACAQTSITVTPLTSFHTSGESTIDSGGTAKGWPSMDSPTSPPLLATNPYSGVAYLFGGARGVNLAGIRNTGFWWMPASPGHYERLEISADMVYGTIMGTPVKSSDDHLYGVMISTAYNSSGSRNFSDDGIDCKGDNLAACLAMTGTYPPKENFTEFQTTRYFTISHSGLVGRGMLFRTEFDGTNLEIIDSALGELNLPNGALVIDAADNLYGVDLGPSGGGRIFKVDADGAFSAIYEFASTPAGKKQVPNGMILGSDGWLYGVSAYPRGLPLAHDAATDPATPVGVAYKIDPSAAVPANTFQILHTFTLAEGELRANRYWSYSDYFYGTDMEVHPSDLVSDREHRENDYSALNWLVEGPDGYLYGTTSLPTCKYWAVGSTLNQGSSRYVTGTTPLCGGSTYDSSLIADDFSRYYDGPVPHGAIYRISMDGSSGLQMLHKFNYTDGSQPRGQLALGKDGAIYGTTFSGGGNHYRTTDSTLKKVEKVSADIAAGTTVTSATGTLWRIIPGQIRIADDGSVASDGFESLHTFEYDVDGRRPNGLSAGSDGRLYGVTQFGGQGYTGSNNLYYYSDDNGAAFMVDLDGAIPNASLSLTFTPSEIEVGETATVTWSSYQARDCVASWRTDKNGTWQSVEPNDSEDISPASGTYYHTLRCVDEVKGTQISTIATFYVNAPITAHDSNHSKYGNGGALPWGLPLLLGILGWRRQRARR